MEYQLSQRTFHEVTLKQKPATLDETINVNALDNCEENMTEILVNLRAAIKGVKIVAPQTPEEQRERLIYFIDTDLFIVLRSIEVAMSCTNSAGPS